MSGHDGLREALERIAALSPKGPFAFPSDELAEAQAIARAALAATPPASDPVGLDVERLADVLASHLLPSGLYCPPLTGPDGDQLMEPYEFARVIAAAYAAPDTQP
jgi:hypothetical protein